MFLGWGAGVITSPRINLTNQALHLTGLHAADVSRARTEAAAALTAEQDACRVRTWALAERWMIPQLALVQAAGHLTP